MTLGRPDFLGEPAKSIGNSSAKRCLSRKTAFLGNSERYWKCELGSRRFSRPKVPKLPSRSVRAEQLTYSYLFGHHGRVVFSRLTADRLLILVEAGTLFTEQSPSTRCALSRDRRSPCLEPGPSACPRSWRPNSPALRRSPQSTRTRAPADG